MGALDLGKGMERVVGHGLGFLQSAQAPRVTFKPPTHPPVPPVSGHALPSIKVCFSLGMD